MNITRRQLLKGGIVAGIGMALPLKFGVRKALAYYQTPQSPGIPLFKTTLRGAGPGGIPVALQSPSPAPVTGVTHYRINIIQYEDQIVPASTGMGPTTLWGYNPTRGLGGNITPTHLGGIIVAQSGQPIQITFHNQLFATKHILPVDTTIGGANQAVNRTAVHFHGGLVPWISDGGPFDWFDPYGNHGLSFLNNQVLNPSADPGEAEYYYPMNQSARFGWYHDHAIGITRLNAYAGIASGLLIRDKFEEGLIPKGLPNYIEAGGNEIPIVIQDKIFVGSNIDSRDPGWKSMVQEAATQPGSLWYAHTYEPDTDPNGRWSRDPGGLTLPDPSAIPEFFGDTMLVNGTVFPEATVQARRYRLRLLNACNARFLNLQLYVDDGSLNGITLGPGPDSTYVPTNAPFVNAATGDSSFLQIGTEGGFLAKPVKVPSKVPFLITDPDFLPPNSGPSLNPSLVNNSLLVAPAERPDLIVDFSGYAGKTIILYNDAPSPFPSGDDRNDYFPKMNIVGNPVNDNTNNGFGPNTRVLMRFKVEPKKSPDDLPLNIDINTDLTPGIDPWLVPWGVTTPPPLTPRFLSLNEYYDEYGRLVQILGNAEAPYGSPYEGTAKYLGYGPSGTTQSVGATEENVKSGDTEVWEIFNTSGDVHPMHFHLVNVQIINRQTVNVSSYPYIPTGKVIPPAPNEVGWKETVAMYPGTVTRVIMKFDVPQIVTASGKIIPTPPSPRTGGSEYVWHCHILEHEEHDMMHALVVTDNKYYFPFVSKP